MQSPPDSTPDFKRGRWLGLIAFAVVVVLGIAGVLALSGVFGSKNYKANPDNKEGCPCNCDRSTAMVAEVRALGGDEALAAIDKSLTTIAEREAGGYITEAMVSHRLRLLDLEREMRQAGKISAPRTRTFPPGDPRLRERLEDVANGGLRVGVNLAVHAQMLEWVHDRQKLQRACFLLSLELENLTDRERVVKMPSIDASAPFPISRWYVSGESGAPWDGRLGAHEKKSVRVIGYVGEALPPKAKIEATIHFESSTFRATTRARSRWNRVEPVLMRASG